MRGSILAAVFLSCASAAYAQEAITQPLPRSEITVGKQIVEGDIFFGEQDDADADIWGLSLQYMHALEARVAINIKVTYLTDDESGTDINVYTVGGAVAYELIEPTAAQTLALTIFGGVGVTFLDIDYGGTDLDDTDAYIEGGIQADIKAGEHIIVIPFFGITHVFNDDDDDTIFGMGAKIQVGIGPGWRFEGGAIFQFNDISEAWLILFGVTKDIN